MNKFIAKVMIWMLKNPSICETETIDALTHRVWVNRYPLFGRDADDMDRNEIHRYVKKADERLRGDMSAAEFFGSIV